MEWVQNNRGWGNQKWHWMPERRVEERWGYEVYVAQCRQTIRISWGKGLPEGTRPALARNNVCSKCKKAYLATRPDLQDMVNRLNDKKDVV